MQIQIRAGAVYPCEFIARGQLHSARSCIRAFVLWVHNGARVRARVSQGGSVISETQSAAITYLGVSLALVSF